MKKMLVVLAVILLSAVNLYAEPGDVYVEDQLGVGTTTPDPNLKADINGKIGATEYCDRSSGNCESPPFQKRVTQSCNSNEKITAVNQDGTVQCDTDITDTTTHIQGGLYGICHLRLAGYNSCVGSEVKSPAVCDISYTSCGCQSGYTMVIVGSYLPDGDNQRIVYSCYKD